MKKAMLLALCLILAGLLAVNGTFAAEFTQAISEAVSTLFKNVEGLFFPDPTTDPGTFKVSLTYLDSGAKQLQLIPGSTVERKVAVHNQSVGSDAYFRIVFAVQASAYEHLTLAFNESDYYQWSDWRDITIGGRAYKLKIGTYTDELPAGETSQPSLLSVALNAAATSEQLAAVDADFLQMQVLAIKAEDFIVDDVPLSPVDALDRALPIKEPFNPFE